jgi:hypothetical protein
MREKRHRTMIGETRVRGLELANVSLKKLLEYRVNSHWFMEHAGTRDYSRLRCFDGKSAGGNRERGCGPEPHLGSSRAITPGRSHAKSVWSQSILESNGNSPNISTALQK